MSIKIDLPLEIEKQLEANAKVLGLSPEEYVLLLIKTDIKTPEEIQRRQELMLLQQINQGFDDEFWSRYSHLLKLRDLNQIDGNQYDELCQMIECIELENAKRIGLVVQLAELRQQPFEDIFKDLGIKPVQLEYETI
jgi:hypothetical protein